MHDRGGRILVALALIGGCTSTTNASNAPPKTTPATVPAPATTESLVPMSSAIPTTTEAILEPAAFDVAGGIEQITVTGGSLENPLEFQVITTTGEVAATGRSDTNGAVLFRQLPAGTYTVEQGFGDDQRAGSDPVEVLGRSAAPPRQSFYDDQQLGDGFGYITTRDGTTLSATVWLPGPAQDGPFPTVVEYSGYAPSNPDDETFAQLFTTLGYAYVGVNIRGTGCSGGSFNFFEWMQSIDGYDVVETVAAQPWAKFNHVGMVGISYPGISQLFVGQTRPPHLAAITPLSVLDDSYRSTLYPGGILNTGFAVSWASERQEQAKPFGQEWSKQRVDAGDKVCDENQKLRLQNPDLGATTNANPYYDPTLGDSIAPATFVDQINVPVFIAGTWQDEQTGGHFPTMIDKFTGSPHVYATLLNGTHTESLSLGVFGRYVEFLDLYVAKRVPSLDAARVIAPILAGSLTGVNGLTLPAVNRFEGMSYEQALAAFEADPPVRVLFEEGAADGQPAAAPLPRFEIGFTAWPIPTAEPLRWFLHGDGSMQVTKPGADDRPTTYVSTPNATPATYYEGSSSGVWKADVVYNWAENPAGTSASWITGPLDGDVVNVGSASVDLWVRADQPDVDFEVSISEVRPDGTEVYVQSGWLRASHRALDEAASSETRPVQRHLKADTADLPDGELTPMRIEVFPFAHPFREGSRIRLVVDAPGGNRAIWAFATTLAAGAKVEVANDAEHPSALVLSLVDVEVPGAPPACGSLRGQPCRRYVAA